MEQGTLSLGLGFRVSGFGFRVSGLGLRVSGLGFRISGLGFLGFRVYGWRLWGTDPLAIVSVRTW